MSRYRQWMYQRLDSDSYVSEEFKSGVKDFIHFAVNQPACMDGSKIRCPCNGKRCRNQNYLEPDVVTYHLRMKGFVENYYCWSSHGETYVSEIHGRQGYGVIEPSPTYLFGPGAYDNIPNAHEAGSSSYGVGMDTYGSGLNIDDVHLNSHEAGPSTNDGYRTMVTEAAGPDFEYPSHDPELPNLDAQGFYDMMKSCETAVYDGCKHSLLSVVTRLMNIKSEYNLSESCYDAIAKLISELLPEENIMPDTFYETKKLVQSLGLLVEKIDACIDGCMIYWGEDVALTKCKFCNLPRFKSKKKRIAHSVMWYFPLAARLKRLYTSKATSSHMRWHAEHHKDPDIMTHPSDAEAWRHFDTIHPEFVSETRNVRLGLCTDGFMPFGQFGKQYSSWPVIVTPYNLPPGMCMKEEFMFLTAIVPGPKNPKQKIDVFLQPLIAELIQLWNVGVQTFDSSRKQNFMLRAALMWTISDFPAYSMLSGWPTSGKLACPYCIQDTDAFTLQKGGKQSWFDNHRKFLPENHPFRRNKTNFTKGEVVKKTAPSLYNGEEILEWIDGLGLMRVTQVGSEAHNKRLHKHYECGWKKCSIFWDLPYWSTNLIRHNLDVMHIEKNCFENVFSTVMDVKGKTKDNDKSREDLRYICDRPELDMDENGLYHPAKYILKKQARTELCDWVKELKFPDGYVSNLGRCVEMKKYQMSGMKSHDCHIFMQRLIPIAFRQLLPEPVWVALTEFSLFFKELTCTSIRVEDMERLEREIPIILCKLEQIFPPSFFDSMEHLPVHLPYEARIAGPVHFRWMYPFERYLKHLKKSVGNKARVEGSIGNAYLTDEASNFGSLYFEPHVHTRRRKVGRNDDGGDKPSVPGNLSIFTYPGRASGKCIQRTLSEQEYSVARSYILLNCKEVEPYLAIFTQYLQDNSIADTDVEIAEKIDKDFVDWFEYFKYFKWPRGLDEPVKDCWKKSAARQYCTFINDRKKDSQKKDYIPAATWSRWTSDWNTPEALELSLKKRNARMGSNGKCSKHTGGSITASEHAKRFEKKHKRKANAIELFDLLHRRKGDKGFVDDKSASIHAAFKARKIELSGLLDESSIPNDDEIYLEIVGGENKVGDVYGIGSQSSSTVNLGSSSSASEIDPEVITTSVVQDIVQQFFTNYEEQHEERVGQRIGKEVESRLTPLQAMLLQVQDLLARFPAIPGAANLDQNLEDSTSDAEEERDENV